ncbi:hypothetical protein V2J09_013520 [Rumex salicifolius]
MRQLRFVACNVEKQAVEDDDDEDEAFYSPRVSLDVPDHQYHRPRRSFHRPPLSASFTSCMNHRRSFSYDRLQQNPIHFTVVKLDGSRFEIEVRKSGRIAELKKAVEKAFDHMPTNDPGKISWQHVWGHFCLCYDGQKLVKDELYITDYRMKEGDELCFVHHVSEKKRRMKKQAGKAEIQEVHMICNELEAIPEVEEDESDQLHAEDEVSTSGKESMSTTSNLLKKFLLHSRPTTNEKGRFKDVTRTSKFSNGFKGASFTYMAVRQYVHRVLPRLKYREVYHKSTEIGPAMSSKIRFVWHKIGIAFIKIPLQAALHHHLQKDTVVLDTNALNNHTTPPPTATAGIAVMANMLMASSSTKSLNLPIPKLSSQIQAAIPKPPTLRLQLNPQSLSLSVPQPLKSLATAVATSVSLSYLLPLPSLAEEFEKAQLFDFDLTLPIIAAEFLFLMFTLDKLYYSPLGNFMDSRDAEIKEKLASVKDSSSEVKEVEEQAAAVMRAARAEIAAALNKMKKETTEEVEKLLEEGRSKVEAELAEALVNLEKQKEATILSLDSQISALSEEIVKKVLPV